MSNKPTYEDMYGSEYFRPEDLPKAGIRVKFVRADVRELRCAENKKWKVCLFAQTVDGQPIKKLIAVNKTSAKQLCVVWGKPSDDTYSVWLNKLADLTHVKIKAFGKMADAVLITPVTQAVEETGGNAFENASPTPPAQTASGIQRPQRKAGPLTAADAVKPEAAKPPETTPVPVEAKTETVDPTTGEVFEPGSFEPPEEPLDEITINDIKSTDSKGKTYFFLYCSDNRIYTTTDGPTAAKADEKRANKTGVIITADKPLKNSKGIEYFPVLELK